MTWRPPKPPPTPEPAPQPKRAPLPDTPSVDAFEDTAQERSLKLIRAFTQALHGEDAWNRLSRSEQGRIRGAVRDLPDDTTPDQILEKTAAYAKDNPDITITANAVVANWNSIGRQRGSDITDLQQYRIQKVDSVTLGLATRTPQHYTREDGLEVTFALRLVDGQEHCVEGICLSSPPDPVYRYRSLNTGREVKPTGVDTEGAATYTTVDRDRAWDDRHGPGGWNKPPDEIRRKIHDTLGRTADVD